MTRLISPATTSHGKPGLSREETIDELLRRSKRTNRTVPIRRAFVQRLDGAGPDAPKAPGPLCELIRNEHAFDLLMLVYAVTAGDGYGVTERSETWGRATGTSFRTDGSASAVISRLWLTLERNKLIKRSSDGRRTRVTKLLEDGSERAYTPPSGSRESRRDVYFQLPFQYWTSGLFTKLDMPAKAVLLIAMSLRKREFVLPSTQKFAGYYGISASTLHRGVTTLLTLGILTVHEPEHFVDFTAPSGIGIRTPYSLTSPYDRSIKIASEEERAPTTLQPDPGRRQPDKSREK
ncbi:hypothetical protein ACWDA3_59100 [Nonomuraea rubra]